MPNGRQLRGISGEEAIRAFVSSGYSRRHGKGSHVKLDKSGLPSLSIPLHRELKVGLLLSQIKRAGLSTEEFLELLGR